jgi:hypothetical protein
MSDDTRDIAIALRSEVSTLKTLVQELAEEVRALRDDRIQEKGAKAVLLWLGGVALAAAGGVGAVFGGRGLCDHPP